MNYKDRLIDTVEHMKFIKRLLKIAEDKKEEHASILEAGVRLDPNWTDKTDSDPDKRKLKYFYLTNEKIYRTLSSGEKYTLNGYIKYLKKELEPLEEEAMEAIKLICESDNLELLIYYRIYLKKEKPTDVMKDLAYNSEGFSEKTAWNYYARLREHLRKKEKQLRKDLK